MNREFEGRVVIITGGARGQGRSHAIEFARRGANVVVCDVQLPLATMDYDLASQDDLAETVKLVEQAGSRCIGINADVREADQMNAVAARAVEEFGRIDILCANAGVSRYGTIMEMDQAQWDDLLAINLTGVWNSFRAVLPAMLERNYGRVIVTSSSLARRPLPRVGGYIASKMGVIGLTKVLSQEVYLKGITANVICPSIVPTPIVMNAASLRRFAPDVENPSLEDAAAAWKKNNPYGDPYIELEDVTAAVLFYASDAARHISGTVLDVQAGGNAGTAI